jgi:hypothetical protein
VAALRVMARRLGLREVTSTPRRTVRCSPVVLADWQELRLARQHPRAVYNASAGALELPLPRDADLVGWLARTLQGVLGPASKARATTGR